MASPSTTSSPSAGASNPEGLPAQAGGSSVEESVDLGTLGATPDGGAVGDKGSNSALSQVGVVTSESGWNPYLFDRSPAWMLMPALALVLVGTHLLRLRPAGYRSEIRPAPGAEFSPLSQFSRKPVSPPQKSSPN